MLYQHWQRANYNLCRHAHKSLRQSYWSKSNGPCRSHKLLTHRIIRRECRFRNLSIVTYLTLFPWRFCSSLDAAQNLVKSAQKHTTTYNLQLDSHNKATPSKMVSLSLETWKQLSPCKKLRFGRNLLKRKLLTLGRDTAFHQAGQE